MSLTGPRLFRLVAQHLRHQGDIVYHLGWPRVVWPIRHAATDVIERLRGRPQQERCLVRRCIETAQSITQPVDDEGAQEELGRVAQRTASDPIIQPIQAQVGTRANRCPSRPATEGGAP